jgi:4-amino-4-deoxy-L-arabinose transferase-like glycosyltransferase
MKALRDYIVQASLSRWAVIVILLALMCGILYAFSLGNTTRYPDEEDYFHIVQSLKTSGIYSRDGLKPTAFRPPGYPFYLFILASGRGIEAYRIANVFAFCACLALLFAIVRREAGERAAIIAILIAVFYPLNVYVAGTVFPQSLISFLFLLGLFLYFRPAGLRPLSAVATGLVFGLLLLTAPACVCVVAILCFTAFLEKRRHHKVAAALLLVTTLAVTTPWQIRNYRTFHRSFFISTNGGINLLLGNSEHTRPNAGTNVDLSIYEKVSSSLNEADRNDYLMREALKYMKQNPGRTLAMHARKFLNYFNYRNELKMKNEQSGIRTLLVIFTYVPIMFVVVIRLFQVRRYPLTRFERYAVCLYVLNGAFTALFFTRIRFRIPFDYLMFSLAALQLSRWLTRRGPGRESVVPDRFVE